jgi:uncharacterized protein (TIGR00288 family)
MENLREDAPNIAIFCDYENVAIGVQDADYDEFELSLVLERLLDKGKIVVKKAYADWDNYKSAKRPMHEAAFEMIEVPHVTYSGKNSADIRLVVDALDICYTKAHLDLFVIISGDSDFSPLVGKLRENNKTVIGVGVKNSTSDLLVENCDEYIYYDDLVRGDKSRGKSRNSRQKKNNGGQKKNGESKGSKQEAIEMVLDQVEALFRERDSNLWSSLVKQTLQRKRPNFSEGYYGYRNFSELLEDAQDQGLLELQKDEKSGGYVVLGFGPKA